MSDEKISAELIRKEQLLDLELAELEEAVKNRDKVMTKLHEYNDIKDIAQIVIVRRRSLKMFYIIGLGLGDVKDITVKGLEIVKKCSRVYLEAYTSILIDDILENMKSFYGKDIIIADREMVESSIVGDPFGATTHTDLVLRAHQTNIPTKVIHNASILNAAGCCGLQLYNFGETVSIPFWTDSWKPDSFYDKIVENKTRGLHTLCLLDIQVKEPTLESLTRKVRQYQPPRFMSVSQAAQQLLDISSTKPGKL
ncbi:hypothetical protein WDU94_012574 [Cyamophila willieti]